MSRSLLVPPAVLLLAVLTAAVGSSVTGTLPSRESASTSPSTERSAEPAGERVTLPAAQRALELGRAPTPRPPNRRAAANVAHRRATLHHTFDELLAESGYRANTDSIDVSDVGRTVRRGLARAHDRTGPAPPGRSVLRSTTSAPIDDLLPIDLFRAPRSREARAEDDQVGTTSESASSEVATREVAPVWRR